MEDPRPGSGAPDLLWHGGLKGRHHGTIPEGSAGCER
jgi:hypothetical protein